MNRLTFRPTLSLASGSERAAEDYQSRDALPMIGHDSSVRVLAPRQWWYVAPPPSSPAGTAAEGPRTMAQVQTAIQAGAMEGMRLVWTPGMASWEPAGYQPEFSFEFSPPPLPAA